MSNPWEWLTIWNPLAWLWEQLAGIHPYPGAIRLLGIVIGGAAWAIASRLLAEFACKDRGRMVLWWIFFFVFNIYAIIFYVINEEYQRRLQKFGAVGRRIVYSDRKVDDIVHSAAKSLEPSEEEEPELLELVRNRQFDKALAQTLSLRDVARSMGDDAGVDRYDGLIDWVKKEQNAAEQEDLLREEFL